MSKEPLRKKLRGSNITLNNADQPYNAQILLHNAIKKNDKKLINELLKNAHTNGIDVNFTSKNYAPVLILAIEAENYELVKKLIAAGADVNLKSRKDYSYLFRQPLHLAVFKGHKKIVELLLENNADINAVDGYDTALSIAAEKNHFKIAKLLLNNGAQVNPLNSIKPLFSAIRRNNSMAEYLIKRGADVNAFGRDYILGNSSNCTPLELAIYSQNTDGIQLLIDKKADVNYKDGCNSLLRTAVITGSVTAVKILLNCDRIIINSNESPGMSPLHIYFPYRLNATKNILTALLDAGVNINQLSNRGETVIDYFKKFYPPIKKPIFQHIIKLKAAELYVSAENLKAVEGNEHENFYSACCAEIQTMKDKKILDMNFSFYDVLHKSRYIVALALMITNQIKCFYERDLRQLFPLYGGIIYYRLKRAFYRKKLIVKVDEMLYGIFNAHLPDVIKRMIYLYLSNEDLIHLV